MSIRLYITFVHFKLLSVSKDMAENWVAIITYSWLPQKHIQMHERFEYEKGEKFPT